jgi:hypothetical protein
MLKRIQLVIIVICSSFSCVKEFKFDIIELPKQVVVNSLFCPDSLFKINVSITAPIGVAPERVNNALVVVYKNDIIHDTFTAMDGGWYKGVHFPEVGASYKVVVKVPDYDSVWATSYVPEFPEIIGQPVSKIFGEIVIDGDQILARDAYLTFQDLDYFDNYYEVFFKDGFQYSFHKDRVTDESLIADSDMDIQGFIMPSALYFSNSLFRGIEKTLVLPGFGSVFIGFPTLPVPFRDLYFASISREFFLFRKGLFRHLYNFNGVQQMHNPISLLFIGNPTEMYSNVQGGSGVFAGYNMKIIQVEIEY